MEYLHLFISKFTLTNALKVWNYIMVSNLFNFVFFAAVFVVIFKKINIGNIISSLQEGIVKIINDAKKNKEESLDALKSAEESVKDLPELLEEISADTDKSISVIRKKITAELNQQVETISNNAVNIIEAEEKLIAANLTKDISKISVEMARKKVKWQLLKDESLHEKYINDSIDELDRLNF